jgi:hypothetical protein
MRDRFAQLG